MNLLHSEPSQILPGQPGLLEWTAFFCRGRKSGDEVLVLKEKHQYPVSYKSDWLLVQKTLHCIITVLAQLCSLYLTLFRALRKFIGQPHKATSRLNAQFRSLYFGMLQNK